MDPRSLSHRWIPGLVAGMDRFNARHPWVHNDHFHVRLRCPAGAKDCIAQNGARYASPSDATTHQYVGPAGLCAGAQDDGTDVQIDGKPTDQDARPSVAVVSGMIVT